MKKLTKMLGVRIEVALATKAARKAEREHQNLSQVVRMLLEDWLKKRAA